MGIRTGSAHNLDMESIPANYIEVSIRMLQNGKYVWTITGNSPIDNKDGLVEILKNTDGKLRDAFPDHVQKGSTRTVDLDE